jgi:hypothetical protein
MAKGALGSAQHCGNSKSGMPAGWEFTGSNVCKQTPRQDNSRSGGNVLASTQIATPAGGARYAQGVKQGGRAAAANTRLSD